MVHRARIAVKSASKSSALRAVLFVAVFALAGILIVYFANAATSVLSNEPESGTLNGQTTIVNDANVSGGKYVRFGSANGLNATLTPALLADNTNLINPLRGFHFWRNQTGVSTIPQPAPYPLDGYDRYYWSDFETTKGTYDFSKLTNAINAFTDPAKNGGNTGRRYGFRMRAMSDGSDGSVRFPQYLVDTNCATLYATKNVYVPNWNQTCFQDSMDAFLAALSTALQPYKQKINFIDIGMYGQWGEWSLYQYPAEFKASDATLNFIIDEHIKYFGWSQLLLFVVAPTTQVNYAMDKVSSSTSTLKKPIGLRTDCYDCTGFLSASDKMGTGRPASMLDRWKTAPLIGERGSLSTANGQTGLDSVKQYHISSIANDVIAANRTTTQLALYDQAGQAAGYKLKVVGATVKGAKSSPTVSLDWANIGSAPPYDAWKVKVWIEKSGVSYATGEATLPNANVLPAQSYTQAIATTVITPLTAGTYTVKLKVVHADSYLPNMQLLLANGTAAAGYTLGDITVN